MNWAASCDLQEHPTAAQTIDHPIVKDARPEYPGADERINVFSLSAINGGDRSDASQCVYKVYRRLVHRLCETRESAFSVRLSQMRGETESWEVPPEMEKREKKRTNRSKFD